MNLSSPITVAIVDDDERLCRSLGRMLRAAGIRSQPFLEDEDSIPFPEDIKLIEDPAKNLVVIMKDGKVFKNALK